MEMEPASPRRFLGMVEVDSGTLVVGDPAYLLASASRGKEGIDYQAVIEAPDGVSTYLAGQPVLLIGGFGGDGTFPVYGEFEDGELARVTIEFVGPDEDEDEKEVEDAGH